MATLEDAQLARRKNARRLLQLGAWGITVDEVKRGTTKSFVVVALFQKKPTRPIPKELQASKRGSTITVPLVIRVQKRFLPG